MTSRTLMSFIVATLLLGLPSAASAAIKFKKIAFDPPGSDSGRNSHLNAEWVLIKNTGTSAKDLTRWTVNDKGADHRYRFESLSLAGGDLVKLHSGRGEHRVTAGCGGDCLVHHYYWGLDNYVWNNDGDKATLKNSVPKAVDSCLVPGGKSPVKC